MCPGEGGRCGGGGGGTVLVIHKQVLHFWVLIKEICYEIKDFTENVQEVHYNTGLQIYDGP